jgi:PhzF family phenazine biosynthesis protein
VLRDNQEMPFQYVQPIVQVDAFTAKAFGGNPAAVCVMQEPREEAWMANVAMEMNLSETAFLYPEDDGGYRLRWFTPSIEVDLCGHATLASAHVLWTEAYLDLSATARFHTKSGLLTCERSGEWIEMDFPVKP